VGAQIDTICLLFGCQVQIVATQKERYSLNACGDSLSPFSALARNRFICGMVRSVKL
jgi:hypothetical protein